MIELTVRLVASLAIVVGLLLVTVRIGGRRFRPRAGAPLRIVHRQALSRGSSLAVVEVGSRVLVLGTTEQQINVLAELDPAELETAGPAAPAASVADQAWQDEVIDMESVRRTTGRHAAEVREPEVVVPPRAAAAPVPSPVVERPVARHQPTGALAGSVLSAQTWRDAFSVATGRAR